MKLGLENRRTVIIAGVLAVVALLFVARAIYTAPGMAGATPPRAAVKNPGTPAAPPRRASNLDNKASLLGLKITPGLDPRLRLDLLRASENVTYEGSGRNIFRADSGPAIPNPKFDARGGTSVKEPTGPKLPPPPPQIPLKFYGWASRPGQAKRVFLLQGQPEHEDLFVAREGDIIARRYKVLKINPTAVEIEDMLTNTRQSIPLSKG